MIQEFIDSWSLFAGTYLAGWAIALLLSSLGWLIVARDQIFIGAAVSQASTLGIAIALYLGYALAGRGYPWLEHDWFIASWAVTLSLTAAILTNFGGSKGRLSREALTGWVFLASSSLAILLLFHTPIGLKEIQERLSSSIIGASIGEIILFGGLFLITLVTMIITRHSWILLALDPPSAAAVGLRIRRWEFVWAIWLGFAVGLAIRSGGTLYTFGCLVLPPLVANQLCREVGQLVFLSPLVGFTMSVFGFIIANYYDFPPAQITIAFLSILLLAAWIARRLLIFLF